MPDSLPAPAPIPAVYRPMQPAEVPAVLALWSDTFGEPPAAFAQAFFGDAHWRPVHTWVAVDPRGEVLAAAHCCWRELRDVDGTPQPTGGLAALVTRREARGQGHAGRLVTHALAMMRAEDFAWSLLFTDVNAFYERYGWRTYRTRYRQGALGDRLPGPGAFTIRCYDPAAAPGGWRPLAAIYDAYNSDRPLTTVRELPYWETYVARRLTAPTARILIAEDPRKPGHPVGYLVLHLREANFGVTEIGVYPDEEAAIPALLGAAGEAARAANVRVGRVYLPAEPAVDAALTEVFRAIETGYHDVLMGCPLAAGWDDARIAALFAAPGAIPWPADDF